MELKRQAGDGKNFFLLNDDYKSNGFFVYCPAFPDPSPNAKFDLNKAFTNYTFKFLIVFAYAPALDYRCSRFLDPLVNDSRKFLWTDSFEQFDISRSARILINGKNEFKSFFNFENGDSDNYQIFFKRETAFGGTISFDSVKKCLVIPAKANKYFKFITQNRLDGENRYALFNRISIPLEHLESPSANFKTSVGRNIGSLLFKSSGFGEKAIQPSSPFRLTHDSKETFTHVDYFDNASFKNSVDLFCTYFPYQNVSNDKNTRSSIFEFGFKSSAQSVDTNFVNNKGIKFYIDEIKNLSCRVGYLQNIADVFSVTSFPDEGSQMTLCQKSKSGNDQKLLLGYSGTEAVAASDASKITLVFKTDKQKVKVLSDSNSFLARDDVFGSVTSIPQFTVAADLTKLTHFLDAEKAALFENTAAQVDYKFIDQGFLKKDTALPVIPLLSFTGNPELKILEKVFSAHRLNSKEKLKKKTARIEENKKYITPQGFLKHQKGLDFIRYGGPASKNTKAVITDRSYNRFRISSVDADADFNTSISKEDVFFVTTPKMLLDIGSKVIFDIFFKIKNFSVDFLPYPQYSQNDYEKIVIFKYSNSRFEDLLNDVTKWSNFGAYGNDLQRLKSIQANIKEQISKFQGSEYDYFNNVINAKRDANDNSNWNGVIVLNVPIADAGLLPSIFTGLTASQNLQPDEAGEKLKLKTKLKFQFVAFPINKTTINSLRSGRGDSGAVEIQSTSFNGLIDYDLLKERAADSDYKTVSDYFPDFNNSPALSNEPWKFVLTKLLVKFVNSEISTKDFVSFAFLQIPNLFDNGVRMEKSRLTHSKPQSSDSTAIEKDNLIRLQGYYQKDSGNEGNFTFEVESNVVIEFNSNRILKEISISRVAFTYVGGAEEDYRFDLDGRATFDSDVDGLKQLISFGGAGESGNSIGFEQIGLRFPFVKGKLPSIKFDISNLVVLPRISFDGKGFLKSFPIKFNRLETFRFKDFALADFNSQNFDFFNLYSSRGYCPDKAMLWGLIFDFDLGTLGNLGLLKALKGELLLGWTAGGGFKLGLKLTAPSSEGLHIDLFGALKLDITDVKLCSFPNGADTTYFLRLVNARLTIMGLELPPKDLFDINGIIFANPGEKVAWFVAATKKSGGSSQALLPLGIGQRVGLTESENQGLKTVEECITKIKDVFSTKFDSCAKTPANIRNFYQPTRNWLVASDNILPEEWQKVVDIKFVFNDPALYGIYLGLKGAALKGFSVNILYRKLSENLGVWSIELQLPDYLRNVEMGAASVTIPNIGIEIYTNGGWKLDIGFPRGSDYSRSCLIQIRPFVGWAGFYVMKSLNASLTLFKGVIPDSYSENRLLILQAGFAIRIGIGAYINKGIFYAGASISVYGILEGAFAFEKSDAGLAKFFPNHFALSGRVGAIAELVGYVDFKIVKASIYIMLRQEVGMLLVYLDRDITDQTTGQIIRRKGLQPVNLYIEGEVSVRVTVTIKCFKIFGKKICIKLTFSFGTTVRFSYTLGGSSSTSRSFAKNNFPRLAGMRERQTNIAIEKIRDIPVTYVPGVSQTKENKTNDLKFVHSFAIPFFALKFKGNVIDDEKQLEFSDKNIFRLIVSDIFEDLIGKLPTAIEPRYENLRSILLTGKVVSDREIHKIELTFPNYRPWFILEHDIQNYRDTVFAKFGFSENEAKTFVGVLNQSGGENLFRMISAPISSKIKVSKADLEAREEITNGKITIENLVADGANEKITVDFSELLYSEEDLKTLEEFFHDYKTQFVERGQTNGRKLSAVRNQPLREDFVVSEYFKLIALLTLESYYNAGSDKHKQDKNDENYDPVVTASAISHQDSAIGWKLNEHLESIIGQINYFYNSGLRLPDLKAADPAARVKTKSYFEILKQCSDITGISAKPLADVKVTLSGGTSDIDLKSELFRGGNPAETEREVAEFKQEAADSAGVVLTDLVNNFSVEQMPPFELTNAKLAIQNSRYNIKTAAGEKPQRFFAMPEKLQSGNSEYRISLNYAERKKEANTKRIPYIPRDIVVCANVEIKARAHKMMGKKVQILEISSVNIEDLTLMNQLKESTAIKNIALYHRYKFKDAAGKEAEELTPIASPYATIIKTNLSTKTHPPVIDASTKRRKSRTVPLKYIAESSDKVNFTKLFWEGLTTNNGGYYLLLDKEYIFEDAELPQPGQPPQPDKQYTLVVSFELDWSSGNVSGKFPAFCNYLKITDDANPVSFNGLDKNTHYLYADIFTGAEDEPVRVREYQSKIPPHCFGFELNRLKKVPRVDERLTSQYLPVEFQLNQINQTGLPNPILSKDKILPLMPFDDDKVPDKLFYRHVSPLRVVDDTDENNIGRYNAVGEKYKIKFGLRDIFGFRAAEIPAELSYTHCYFDKLVPLESWSLLRFSYWFESYANDEFKWKMTGAIDSQGLLPLVGIEKNDIVTVGGKQTVKLEAMARVAGSVTSLLENLYTVLAQISDRRVTVEIPGYNVDFIAPVASLKGFLQERINSTIRMLETFLSDRLVPGSQNDFKHLFLRKRISEFKTELAVNIEIKRSDFFAGEKYRTAQLDSTDIWDYQNVKSSVSSIKLENPSGATTIKDLDALIAKNTSVNKVEDSNKYCLGLSSNKERAKVIYLIRKDTLKKVRLASSLTSQTNYYGILPYKNKLWSGSYAETGSTNSTFFTNIDLDKSLKIVLAKIDELLGANSLLDKKADTALLDKLIIAKKNLVSGDLSQKVDNVETSASENDLKFLKEEFGNLLLEKLNNFYDFDGIIKTNVNLSRGYDDLKKVLADHRLTIGFDKRQPNPSSKDATNVTEYNVISSKIGNLYNTSNNGEWLILFDQIKNNNAVRLKLNPQITHFEFGIKDTDSEIKESTWVQLISPIQLDPIDTGEWKRIIREFPAKPVITKHSAIQKERDKKGLVWSSDLGQWNYEIGIMDNSLSNQDGSSAYQDGDQIEFVLETVSNFNLKNKALIDVSREGLIAYWADKISAEEGKNFSWKNFVIDLESHLKAKKKVGERVKALEELKQIVIERQADKKWKLLPIVGIPANIVKLTQPTAETKEISLKIGPFNIFDAGSRVISANAKVRVLRNKSVSNPKFQYETDTVEPPSWVTPHIRFFNVLKANSPAGLTAVFSSIPVDPQGKTAVALKSTAKFAFAVGEPEDAALPFVPVRQMEFAVGAAMPNINSYFIDYENGHPSVSLTVYSGLAGEDSNLPVFHAEIVKKI